MDLEEVASAANACSLPIPTPGWRLPAQRARAPCECVQRDPRFGVRDPWAYPWAGVACPLLLPDFTAYAQTSASLVRGFPSLVSEG